jgi:hypothetical protein
MKSIIYGLIFSVGFSFPLFADTVKAYQIKYATYFGGYVKYIGANTWHNNIYITSGDRMKEINYMGDKEPKAAEPYKLYQGDKCFHVITTVNPPKSTYYDITEFIPINKAGGGKQYLNKIFTSKKDFINSMNPKPDGKKLTVAGYLCDGYTGKGPDGKVMAFYFSKDPALLKMLDDIDKNTKNFANTMAKSIFFEHPQFGILMKYDNIEEPTRKNPLYKPSFEGSKFVITEVKETVVDPEIFSLDGMSEVPVDK